MALENTITIFQKNYIFDEAEINNGKSVGVVSS